MAKNFFDSWCCTIQGSREGFQNLWNPRKTRLLAGFFVLAFRSSSPVIALGVTYAMAKAVSLITLACQAPAASMILRLGV
jgi:hypothetical protein